LLDVEDSEYYGSGIIIDGSASRMFVSSPCIVGNSSGYDASSNEEGGQLVNVRVVCLRTPRSAHRTRKETLVQGLED
jgi:hypothetical protein